MAELYEVPTKRLNEAVKRNRDRFPEDFMFQLSKEELANWRSQIATSNPSTKMGLRRPPYVFTEHGVAMLSSVYSIVKHLIDPPPKPQRKMGFRDREKEGDDEYTD